MSQPVEIYGRDDCRFCAAAVAWCLKRQYPFIYHDIGETPVRASMLMRAPGATTVPQIFIGDHRIGGYDALQRSDHLIQQMVGGH